MLPWIQAIKKGEKKARKRLKEAKKISGVSLELSGKTKIDRLKKMLESSKSLIERIDDQLKLVNNKIEGKTVSQLIEDLGEDHKKNIT